MVQLKKLMVALLVITGILLISCADNSTVTDDNGNGETTTYKVDVSVEPSVAGTISPSASEPHEEGDDIELQAEASESYSFSYWSGDVDSISDNPLKLTVNKDFSLIAHFEYDAQSNPCPNQSTSGYQVWIGTSATPKNAVLKKDTWTNAARLIEGVNINRTPVRGAEGTPSENEESLSRGEFNEFINTFKLASQNGFIPIPRTHFKNEAFPERDDLISYLERRFQGFDNAGYIPKGIMFYDNFVGSNPDNRVVYKWTEEEVQKMRDWLDDNQSEVRLLTNARNFGKTTQNWIENPLVDDVVIEANPNKWYDDAGRRQDLLKWLWTNKKTANKRIIFQVPVNNITEPYDSPTGYQQMRDWVRWLGVDLMGMEFMRSERVVIMPVTYNPAFTFYPETTNNGKQYANTMTGIALSLLEQKSLFQGCHKLPKTQDAYSYKRNMNK